MVSSGRCTKGLDISLRRIEYKNMKYNVLVIDSEGINSTEKNDESFDKKLALIAMVSAKKLIINVKGEIHLNMQQILSVSLFAGKKLESAEFKPSIYFCLRDMKDIACSK